jgi:hypothetical protein
LAAIPIILFLKTIFGRSRTMKLAAADFKRQVDYLVWVILLLKQCLIEMERRWLSRVHGDELIGRLTEIPD